MNLQNGASTNSFISFTVHVPILTITPNLSRKSFRKQRLYVLVRDNFTCQVEGCHENHWGQLTVHHLIPRAAGGSDNLDNLITVCFACHSVINTGSDVVTFKGVQHG